MTWARHASPMTEGRFDRMRAVEEIHNTIQNGRAARAVAGRADDAEDCAQLLAMLGLHASDGKRC